MAGLGLALLGGALQGFGEGQMEAIKKTREEKLRQLELDRAERIEANRQKFQSGESALDRQASAAQAAAQLKATQANTAATLAVQERIATAGNKSSETIATNQQRTALDIANIGNASSESIAAGNQRVQLQVAGIGAGADEKRTAATIASNERIADMQIEAQERAGIKPVTTVVDGKNVVRLEKNGKLLPQEIDPNTNKPVEYAIDPKADTPQIVNHKYLKSIGVDSATAASIAFPPAGSDPRQIWNSAYGANLKAIVGDYGTASEEDKNKAATWTTEMFGPMPTQSGGALAGAPAASAAPATLPEGETPESMYEAAKAAIAANTDPEAVKKELKRYGLDPAQVGL